MLRLVRDKRVLGSEHARLGDSPQDACQRTIDVGSTPEAEQAIRRLRLAAQRALRADPGGVRNFKAFAIVAALRPWMLDEAADLDLELRSIAAEEARLVGGVSREVTAVLRLLRVFLLLHCAHSRTVEAEVL